MRVSDSHKSLWHYTTGPGLEGIVREQQLRATNIRFLSDSEERVGFFKRRLPNLLYQPIHETVGEWQRTENGSSAIAKAGGVEQMKELLLHTFCDTFQDLHERVEEPYITSFCASKAQHPDDGLLSQWRGYGEDGGYAIVFNTLALEDELAKEQKYDYQYFMLSDIEYADPGGDGTPLYPQTVRFEETIRRAVRDYIFTQDVESYMPMYEALTILPCIYKHIGFSEETEVRIVAIPIHDELRDTDAVERGEAKPRKPVFFRSQVGLLIPFLNLLGPHSDCPRLPIERVIVGPHSDSIRRKKSVEMLLKQYGVQAEVVISGIPYVGR